MTAGSQVERSEVEKGNTPRLPCFESSRSVLRAALVAVVSAFACGGCRDLGAHTGAPRTAVAGGPGRPSVSVVEREGDARGALALAVTTEGIAPERGATVAVALAALVEDRLGARGVADAGAVGGWNGWRLRLLVASSADAARIVDLAREAMLANVLPQDPALAAVARKVVALAHRPLPDRAAIDVARCTGEAYGSGDETPPTAGELETWRRAAHGVGRVAIATAGDASLANATANALANAPAWPKATAILPSPWPDPDARAVVYDASGQLPAGAARIVVTAHTIDAERAAAAAPVLGDPRGPLVSRLAALDAPARVRSVVATAHVDGGCLAATLDLSARDLMSDAPVRIATAVVLARQEVAVEIADIPMPPDLRRTLATGASDPREAAERAAWWELSVPRARQNVDDIRLGLTVGLGAVRDASEPSPDAKSDSARGTAGRVAPALADAIRAGIDRATLAAQAPVVEARTHVERGQGEAWVLLASTCGTLPEASRDAGTGAAVAAAAAMQAAEGAADTRVEPFVAADGIGILAHGPPRAGETPQAHIRRLADIVGRAFAADALNPDNSTRARTMLLARAGEPDALALAGLGGVLAPNHPSWVDPLGTSVGLGSASTDAMAMRAAAARAGPLRVAVLANADSAQGEAAVRAVDRWVARRPGEGRSCPAVPMLAPPRPGTYAVELPASAPSEAFLALPLVVGDEAERAAATCTAMALDGAGGLLARAVGATVRGDASGKPLAHAWSAAVIGAPRSPALVIRLVAADTSLDAAVAQTRRLLERLHQGALHEEDRARAMAALERDTVAASLDPRARTIDLWRGKFVSSPPSLDALRTFASAVLRDEALIIIALRPARGESERPSATSESRTTTRESSGVGYPR